MLSPNIVARIDTVTLEAPPEVRLVVHQVRGTNDLMHKSLRSNHTAGLHVEPRHLGPDCVIVVRPPLRLHTCITWKELHVILERPLPEDIADIRPVPHQITASSPNLPHRLPIFRIVYRFTHRLPVHRSYS